MPDLEMNLVTPKGAASESEARELFESAGLLLPHVPGPLLPTFHRIDQWLYGSRDIDFWDMYSFWKYPLEALLGDAPEYVAIGHVGHGVNSYAITYQLVCGPVACFVQSAWGGIYMDSKVATAATRDALRKCSQLASLIEDVADSGRRLLVMDGDFNEIRLCEWLPTSWDTSRTKDVMGREWLEQHRESSSEPLSTAIGLLSGRRRRKGSSR